MSHSYMNSNKVVFAVNVLDYLERKTKSYVCMYVYMYVCMYVCMEPWTRHGVHVLLHVQLIISLLCTSTCTHAHLLMFISAGLPIMSPEKGNTQSFPLP